MQTPADAFRRILEVLDRLEIPYMVAGSAASSIHGIARPTLDIDLVVKLEPEQIDDFAAELQRDFYADPDMMKAALRHGRSFNLIHYATSYKFDVFPLQRDEYSQVQFGRRKFAEATILDATAIECAFATAKTPYSTSFGGIARAAKRRSVNGTTCVELCKSAVRDSI